VTIATEAWVAAVREEEKKGRGCGRFWGGGMN
jgi:hypothetical protein